MKINANFDEMTRDLDYVKINISSLNLLQKSCICPILEKYDPYIIYVINYKLRVSSETRKNRRKLWEEFKEFCKNKWKTPEMSLNDAKSFYWVLFKDIKNIGDWEYFDFNHQIRDYISEFQNPIMRKKRLWKLFWKLFFTILSFYFGIDKLIEYNIK